MATKVSESKVIGPELDYKSVQYMHPTYRYLQLFQQTGGAQVTIATGGITESIFELPTQAFCLADSYISGVATTTLLGGAAAWINNMGGFISEISLYTRSGRQLASINNLPNVLSMLRPMNTHMDDFLTNDPMEGLFPSRTGAKRHNNTDLDRLGQEPQYVTVGSAPTAQAGVFPFQLRLGSIKESIFAMRKSLVFPDVILLRIAWGPGTKITWTSTSITDPSDTAAEVPGNITVNNMNLYLAVEQNESIITDLQLAMRAGYSLTIPFITVYKIQLTTTSQTVTLRIGRDKGHTLKKIVHAVFDGDEKKNTIIDHTNVAGVKVASYSTQLDSRRLQDYLITCASPFADYALHKRMLMQTPLMNANVYQYNWFHCDDFSGVPIVAESKLPVSKDNIVSGIPLEMERTWAFVATTANNAYNHYTVVVAYKTLMVTAAGIEVA